MIVSFLKESEHTPTAWGSAHELANNSMRIVSALLDMLIEAILIVEVVGAKVTSELWVSYPLWMILHMFQHVFLVLSGMLTGDTNIVLIFVKVLKM